MILNEVRGWAKGTLPTYQDRKVFFEAIVNGEPDPVELLRGGDERAVRDLIAAAQQTHPAGLTSSRTSTTPGGARMVDVGGKPVTERRAVAAPSCGCRPPPPPPWPAATPQGRRDRHRAHRRHPGRQEDRRADPALPPADALVRGRGGSRCGEARVYDRRPRRARAAQTGVEMEALTAASVAALTVYDMVKGLERGVEVEDLGAAGEDRRQGGLARARRRARC